MAEPPTPSPSTPASPVVVRPPIPVTLPIEPLSPAASASATEAIVAALSNSGPTRVVELAATVPLPSVDRARLEAKLAELRERSGARAYLVLAPTGLDVEHFAIAPLYQRLSLSGRDVLLVANARARHLRTAGLPKEAGGEILKATHDTFKRAPVDGLVAVIDELERRFASAAPAATTAATPKGAQAPPNVPLPVVVLVGLVLVMIVATLLRKRRAPPTPPTPPPT